MSEAGHDFAAAVAAVAGGAVLRLKVVPGARRTRLAGMLGDRLKVQVAAPPEGGKANQAVCRLLADVLGVALRDVAVTAGPTQPLKSVTVSGLSAEAVVRRLKDV